MYVNILKDDKGEQSTWSSVKKENWWTIFLKDLSDYKQQCRIKNRSWSKVLSWRAKVNSNWVAKLQMLQKLISIIFLSPSNKCAIEWSIQYKSPAVEALLWLKRARKYKITISKCFSFFHCNYFLFLFVAFTCFVVVLHCALMETHTKCGCSCLPQFLHIKLLVARLSLWVICAPKAVKP